MSTEQKVSKDAQAEPTKYSLYKYQHMLKPCPLCGGRARLKTNEYERKKMQEYNPHVQFSLWYCVICINCGLRINYLSSMEEAVNCWNRRIK